MLPPSRNKKPIPPSFPESPIQPQSPRDRMLRDMRARGAWIPNYVGLGSIGDTLKAVAGTLIAVIVLFGVLALILMLIAR